MRFFLRGWLIAPFISILMAQTPVITVTPDLVSASVGTKLYCGLRLIKDPQYQVYCYTSVIGTWDTIVKNAIDVVPVISANDTAPGMNLPATEYYAINSTGPVSQRQCSWLVWRDSVGFHWRVTIQGVSKDGSADVSGKFQ